MPTHTYQNADDPNATLNSSFKNQDKNAIKKKVSLVVVQDS